MVFVYAVGSYKIAWIIDPLIDDHFIAVAIALLAKECPEHWEEGAIINVNYFMNFWNFLFDNDGKNFYYMIKQMGESREENNLNSKDLLGENLNF